jgi:hypothetical protein
LAGILAQTLTRIVLFIVGVPSITQWRVGDVGEYLGTLPRDMDADGILFLQVEYLREKKVRLWFS